MSHIACATLNCQRTDGLAICWETGLLDHPVIRRHLEPSGRLYCLNLVRAIATGFCLEKRFKVRVSFSNIEDNQSFPNYYQLLGVKSAEQDNAALEKAARHRLAQLAAVDPGAFKEAHEKIVPESAERFRYSQIRRLASNTTRSSDNSCKN